MQPIRYTLTSLGLAVAILGLFLATPLLREVAFCLVGVGLFLFAWMLLSLPYFVLLRLADKLPNRSDKSCRCLIGKQFNFASTTAPSLQHRRTGRH